MTTPIIFKITEAGKNAILDIDNIGLTLRLSHFAIGNGKYTPTGNETQLSHEISRHLISAGDIEPTTHTLRFSTSLMANNETKVYEVGIFTQDNVLFALASSENQPLFKIYPDVVFVASFGLMLNEFDDISRVSIITDPNGALSLQLMQQHLAHADPHPQYALRSLLDEVSNTVIKKLQQQVEQLKIPVGGLFVTTKHYANGEAVTAELGYGKWQRALIGRTGVGIDPNANDWTATMGQQYGEKTHTLTIDEMPSHTHSAKYRNLQVKEGEYDGVAYPLSINAKQSKYTENQTDYPIGIKGGSQPHNNVQPSQVIGYWVRMPDNYEPPVYRVYWTSDEQGNSQISQINEGQKVYLWAEVANLTTPQPIGAVLNGDKHDSISIAGGRFNFPETIDNGKTKLGEFAPTAINKDMTISMGISLPNDEQVLASLTVKNQIHEIGRRTTTLPLLIQRQNYGDSSLDMIQLPYIIATASSADDEDYNPKFVEFDSNGHRRLSNNNAGQAGFFPSGGLGEQIGKSFAAMSNPRLHDIWFYVPATQPIKHVGITSSQPDLFGYRVERYTGVYNGLYSDNVPEAIRNQSKDWVILRASDEPDKTMNLIIQAQNKNLDINLDF